MICCGYEKPMIYYSYENRFVLLSIHVYVINTQWYIYILLISVNYL